MAKKRGRTITRYVTKRARSRSKGMGGIKGIAKKAALGLGASALTSLAISMMAPQLKNQPGIQYAGPAVAYFLGGPIPALASLAIPFMTGGMSSGAVSNGGGYSNDI